ncbi:MAG TPA: HEAT repeat domain-containing protein [Xanthomonadales bacterium]|nr:HEAT repeat domain-containing protein [Xanthomonadales bacterium]
MNLEWFLFEFAGLFYVKASLLLAFAIIAGIILRHYSPSTRYRAWNLCLILLILLIPVSLLVPNWDLSLIAPPGYSSLPPVEEVEFAGKGIPARAIPDLLQTEAFNTNHDLSFWELLWIGLIGVWLVGMVVLLAKLVADLVSLGVTSRSGEPAHSDYDELVESVSQRAGCHQKVSVRFCDGIGSPLIWGLFRPTILLPNSARDWSLERLEMVLLHELLHAARMDHTMMVASQLVRCVYWTNPLAWIAVHRHSVERELSCDERVVDCGNDRIVYAEELVAITRDLRREVRYASVAMTEQYGLKARVKSLLDEHLGIRKLRRPIAQVLVAMALVATLSVATASIIVKPDPDSTEALIAALFGADISVADDAAHRLGKRGDPVAVPYLEKLARDSSSTHARQQSILALGKIGGERALQALFGTLEDEDEWIRYSSISALDQFKPKYTKDVQWQAWEEDPSPFVRQRAYLSLIEQDYVGDPRPVMKWMGDEEPYLRRHTIKITGKVCATEAVEYFLKDNKDTLGRDYCVLKLEKGLKDPDPEVRETTINALAEISDKYALKSLESHMPKLDSDTRELARAALKSMKEE